MHEAELYLTCRMVAGLERPPDARELSHRTLQHRPDEILILVKIEVVVPAPGLAVAKDYGRDPVVALSHDKVGEPGDLVHDGLLSDLEDVTEKIGVASEVPDRGHAAPADGMSCLTPPKRSSTRVRDDDPDRPASVTSDGIPDLCSGGHRVGWKKDDHIVLDIALVHPGTDPNMSAGDFGEDERVFEEDIARCIQDRLDEPWVLPCSFSDANGPGSRNYISEPPGVSFRFGVDRRRYGQDVTVTKRSLLADECREVVSLMNERKPEDSLDMDTHTRMVGVFL